jgi:FkbM family methyltransferase
VGTVDRFLIFDVGCNDGQDSDFYLKKGFRVVGIEANPALCEALKKRFADEIAEGRFMLVEEAIAEQAGEVEFYLNEIENIRSTIMPDHAELAAAPGKASNEDGCPVDNLPVADREIWRAVFHEGRYRGSGPALS